MSVGYSTCHDASSGARKCVASKGAASTRMVPRKSRVLDAAAASASSISCRMARTRCR